MKKLLLLSILTLPLLALADGESVAKEKMVGLYGTPYNAPGKWVCTKTTPQLVAKLDRCKTGESAAGPMYECSSINSPNKGEERDMDYTFFKSKKSCQANLSFLAVD